MYLSPSFNNFQLMVSPIYLFFLLVELFWCKSQILYILIYKYLNICIYSIISIPLLYLHNENNLISSTSFLMFTLCQWSRIFKKCVSRIQVRFIHCDWLIQLLDFFWYIGILSVSLYLVSIGEKNRLFFS